jgi:tRNA threonylcarbamoyl adenosine modification protein YeaZ
MGPGPFTGLRVGISFAQSFAFARGITWTGVCSLDAIASQFSDNDFHVAIDARRKEVFFARYTNSLRIGEPKVCQPSQLSAFAIPIYGEELNQFPDPKALIAIAKSAQRNNMAKDIINIKAPTLLIWGLNDTITPPEVGHEFNQLISGSTLRFIDKCCHAPMMERPVEFNEIVTEWLNHNPI